MTQENSTRAELRHAARASQTAHEAAHLVRDLTGLEDYESAMGALEVVSTGIVRRLTPTEANDFLSQLPSVLQEHLLDLPAGPDRNVTIDSIRDDLAAKFGVDGARAAELLRGVGRALRVLVSRGEIAHVRAQLPKDMRDILPEESAEPFG